VRHGPDPAQLNEPHTCQRARPGGAGLCGGRGIPGHSRYLSRLSTM